MVLNEAAEELKKASAGFDYSLLINPKLQTI
jgi:hypothetical protein